MSRTGWFYRPSDRMILRRIGQSGPLARIGIVPKLTGFVMHLTDDGVPIRGEFQVVGRHGRKRLITADELERGTWADKCGMRRPVGADARLAFASAISTIQAEGPDVPELPARAYYNEAGDLVLPDPDAQTFGYLTCAGGPENEANARKVWGEEIAAWAIGDPKTALVLGAVFAGAVLDKISVFAHILNLTGTGQQGKSTVMTVGAALLGDISPRRQQILMTWNSSKQGITQGLRMRGFLPLLLDEHSTAGRTVQESSREFTQITAGAIRAMGGADGSLRDIDGFWHSVLLSSSNEPLRYTGQTEALASRLFELPAPFGRNEWVDADGNLADPAHGAAEHISKRIKRLAKANGGWPLHWANQKGVFRAANLEKISHRFRALSAEFRIASGGIPNTIAETYVAWIVGAEMLGLAIDCPELGIFAEMAARQLLGTAIQEATEANVPDAELLWEALDALRIEASAYPHKDEFEKEAKGGFHPVKGYIDPDEGWWWVVNSVVRDAAAAAGLDNRDAALRQLDELGVHIRGEGKHAQRQLLPKALREVGLGRRMHCFDVNRAADLWAPDDADQDAEDTEGQAAPVAEADARPRAEQLSLEPLGPPPAPAAAPAGDTAEDSAVDEQRQMTPRRRDATEPASPAAPVSVLYPTPAVRVTDPAWAELRRDAAALGVLSAEGLHLPNREVVPMGLPASVDGVVPLMTAYGLRTLYLHQSAADALGLPSFEQWRNEMKTPPGWGAAHSWATPAPDSPISAIYPAGLSEWMSLVVATEDPKNPLRLNLALPSLEGRLDKASEPSRGGFGGAADGAALLDAVMVWTLSTLHHDRRGRAHVFPYYRSPNKTAEELAGGFGDERRAEVLCHAIRNKAVPPAVSGRLVPVIVPRKWHRDPDQDERGRGYLHQYDKTAAWMAAYSGVLLGVGEPEHAPDGIAYSPKHAGYWRVPEVPGRGRAGLPELEFADAEGGGYWVRTHGMDLLRQLYPDWTPEVVEAWYWPTSRRALEGMYKHLLGSRRYILDAIAAGRPGGKWAKQLNGRLYQSFWGHLQRVAGPKQDTTSGGHYDRDIYWRNDWSANLVELACCNTYRALLGFAESGHFPITLDVDAITIASNEPDPELAKPASMVIGDQGGNWSLEGSAPMGLLLPLIDGGKNAHAALALYLKSLEG